MAPVRNSKSPLPFPEERRVTADELRIKILRETSLGETKAIALALVRQMETATVVRCEFCGHPLHGNGGQADSGRS